MQTIQKASLGAALLIGMALSPDASIAELLYDVDFDSPTHTVGNLPTVGAGPIPRDTVSEIRFGTPTVVTDHGDLIAQPLEFDSRDNQGDQIGFDLDDLQPYGSYYIESQFVVTGAQSNGALTFVFDTPDVRSINFFGDGVVEISNPGQPPEFGSYLVGETGLLQVSIDLDNALWTIWINGVLTHTGDFGTNTLDGIRVTTNVTANPPGVFAAIDEFSVIGLDEGSCDRVGFGNLELGKEYAAGDTFESRGVQFDVSPFFFTPGSGCTGGTSSTYAAVRGSNNACGTGTEIEVNNVTLDIDFGGTVAEVLIPFGEYGGTVSLGINGDCEVAQNFADLSGSVLGGVVITVFDFGVPGQSCGVIRLGGEVSQLSIGGQELFIDNLSYCHVCTDLSRSAFEDQTLGSTYNVGDAFISGAAKHSFEPFYQGPGCTNPVGNGFAEIVPAGAACVGGLELNLNNINDRIDFDSVLSWLSLSYGEYGGNVNIQINGDCRNVANFADLNGAMIGGVLFWVIDYGPIAGQTCGNLYAVGSINEFIIGGQELFIDNVRVCPTGTTDVEPSIETSSVTSPLSLRQSWPNPMTTSSTLGFRLEEASEVRLSIFDVGGRVIRTLLDGRHGAGEHQVRWDGTNDRGEQVPAGIYTYRIHAGSLMEARQLIVLK